MTAAGCPGMIVPCFWPYGENNDQGDQSREETQTTRNPTSLLRPSGAQLTRVGEEGGGLTYGVIGLVV